MTTSTCDHGSASALVQELFEDPVQEALALAARVNRRLQETHSLRATTRQIYPKQERDYDPEEAAG